MRLLIGFVVAAAIGVAAQDAGADDVRLYGPKHTVRKHTTQKMPSHGEKLVRQKFRRASYFGAIVCSHPSGCAIVTGYNTLDSAVEQTMAVCRSRAGPADDPCILYATVVPRGYQEGSAETLNWGSAKVYKQFQKYQGTAAAAASDRGTFVWLSAPTLKEAKAAALDRCNFWVEQGVSEEVIKNECRILSEKDGG